MFVYFEHSPTFSNSAKTLAEKHKEIILEAKRYPTEEQVVIRKRTTKLKLGVKVQLPDENYDVTFVREISKFDSFTGEYTQDSSSNK